MANPLLKLEKKSIPNIKNGKLDFFHGYSSMFLIFSIWKELDCDSNAASCGLSGQLHGNVWKCHEIVRKSESAETTTWDPLSDFGLFLGENVCFRVID